MVDMIKDVLYFNESVLKLSRLTPALLSPQEANWLVKALHEESAEFLEAHLVEDLPGAVDALVDLLYFTIGGLYRLGLNADMIGACFLAVHKANVTKKLGVKESRPQDGTVADAVKSHDFIGPEKVIAEILRGRGPV